MCFFKGYKGLLFEIFFVTSIFIKIMLKKIIMFEFFLVLTMKIFSSPIDMVIFVICAQKYNNKHSLKQIRG